MMTMLVATLGLLPAALSHGIGSDSQRPFAIVIVGGLISNLMISIFLLPTLYILVCAYRRSASTSPKLRGQCRIQSSDKSLDRYLRHNLKDSDHEKD